MSSNPSNATAGQRQAAANGLSLQPLRPPGSSIENPEEAAKRLSTAEAAGRPTVAVQAVKAVKVADTDASDDTVPTATAVRASPANGASSGGSPSLVRVQAQTSRARAGVSKAMVARAAAVSQALETGNGR